MKIKDLKINNFGKLKNKQLELDDKINIIYGENESGKSTILKFITSMLYGINRNKAGNYTSDFEKYTPWNNTEFSGKMMYELENGEKYEIYRDFTKKSPKVFDENMEDITKKFTIDKTKGSKFFYDQTQVDEELFLSTIVSEQQSVKLELKEQNNMIQKITNIIGTGEDSISYKNTINKLNKKITNEIGTKNTKEKPINILENKKQELEEEIQYLEKFNNEKYAIDEIRKTEEEQIKRAEEELENAKKIQELNNSQIIEKEKINILRENENDKKREIEELEEQLKEVRNPKLNEVNKKKSIIISVLIFVAGLGIGFAFKSIFIKAILILISLIGASLVLFNLVRINKKNENIRLNIQNKKNNIINEIDRQKKMLEEKVSENIEKENYIVNKYNNEREKIISNIKEKREYEKLIDIISSNELDKKIKELQNTINESKLNLHRIELDENNVIPKLENYAKKIEELESVNEELENLKFLGEAITIAKENIEQAYLEMKNSISPKFTEKLSQTIKSISNGKYENVKLSDEYGLVIENEKGDYIPVEALSIGTIDQLYLSLRLATIEDISNEKLPIILDEPFSYFDDKRLENVIRFFKENYGNRQIIIFTCTNREEKIMKKNNYGYKLIEL